MKKVFTLSMIVMLALNASAQFTKGNKVLGLGLNFQTSKQEADGPNSVITKSQSLNFSTEMGFATRENRLSGFFVGAGFSNNKYEFLAQPLNNNSSESFNVGGGYFTRAYRGLGKNFFVFGEGRAGLTYSHQKYSNSVNPEFSQYAATAGLYPGIAYKWNQRFLFEIRFADFVNVGYAYREQKNNNNQKLTEQSFGIGTSLGLGYLNNIGIGARWIMK
jgi:hypothetical protein